VQQETREEPDGEDDPGVRIGGLPAPDEHRDSCSEYESFEEGQRAERSSVARHRHLMNCFGGLVGFVHFDKTERALEEFLNVLLADEFGSEQFVEIEIGEAAICYSRREHL